MSNDQDLSQEGKKTPAVDQKPESDFRELGSDDVIELTDVVREGRDPFESDEDEPLLLEEEKPDLLETRFTEDPPDWNLNSPSETSELPEEQKDFLPEEDFSALESSDFKFEDTSSYPEDEPESLPENTRKHLDHVLAGLEKEAAAFEKPEDILAELEKDDSEEEDFLSGYEEPDREEKPSDVLTGMDEDHKEEEEPHEAILAPEFPGISEDKMKTLLIDVFQETVERAVRETVERAVQETVERAVRETVSEVAEKVIREAIDALKKSIASSEL